jgi:hypothetical protein
VHKGTIPKKVCLRRSPNTKRLRIRFGPDERPVPRYNAARSRYGQALAICARLGERLYAEHIERALAAL